MALLIPWFIKSIVSSGILYIYYHLALRNKSFHQFNRFYLAGGVLLSVLVPFLPVTGQFQIGQRYVAALLAETVHGNLYFSANRIIPYCIAIVSIVLTGMLLAGITRVFIIKAAGTKQRGEGYMFIETAVQQAPFSFFNNLFWKKGMPTDDTAGEKILKHELAHIQQLHSYDKLFCHLVCCIAWINPFYWLLQKELTIVHEFQADEKCIEAGDAESFAIMLLHSYNNGTYLNPSHSFFNAQVGRRLAMVISPGMNGYAGIKKIAVLPLVLLVLAIGAAGPNTSMKGLQKQHAEKLAAEKEAMK